MEKIKWGLLVSILTFLPFPGFSLTILPDPIFADSPYEVNGIAYWFNEDDATASVAPRTGDYSQEIKIPSTVRYNNKIYRVTGLSDGAFYDCDELTSISIPNSVTWIGNYTFKGCKNLITISVSGVLTYIGRSAFYNCSSLTSVTVIGNMLDIEDESFRYCNNLTSVTILGSAASIGLSAFYGCESLKTINIPDGVTNIGYYAFYGCCSLESITIPYSVTTIGGSAFYGCTGLNSIVIEEGNPVYDSRNNCNALIETQTNTLIKGCQNTTIPNGIIRIENDAFHGCLGLTSVTIPASVTDISYSAFGGCGGLTSINVDSENPNYDSRDNCNAIIEKSTNLLIRGCQSTIIPNGVTSIGASAFDGCDDLTSISIPSSVTDIGSMAFSGCNNLADVYMFSVQVIDDITTMCVEPWGTIVQDSFFANTPIHSAILHVPASALESYQSTEPWNKFGMIVAIEEEEDSLQYYINSLEDTEDTYADNVYKRVFRNDDWQTLYVPFAMDYDEWAGRFEVAGIEGFAEYDLDGDGTTDRFALKASIIESGSIEANKPYLIRAKAKHGAIIRVEKVIEGMQETTSTYFTTTNTYAIKGNYSNKTGLKTNQNYRLSGGSLSIPTNDAEVLYPYRWYLTITEGGNDYDPNTDHPTFGRNLDDEFDDDVYVQICGQGNTLDIRDVENRKMKIDDSVYDLQGRCVNGQSSIVNGQMKKGLYIVDGKKLYVK